MFTWTVKLFESKNETFTVLQYGFISKTKLKHQLRVCHHGGLTIALKSFTNLQESETEISFYQINRLSYRYSGYALSALEKSTMK